MSDDYVSESEAQEAIAALARKEEQEEAERVQQAKTNTKEEQEEQEEDPAFNGDDELEAHLMKSAEIHARGKQELERLDEQIAALNLTMLRVLPVLCVGFGRYFAGWGWWFFLLPRSSLLRTFAKLSFSSFQSFFSFSFFPHSSPQQSADGLFQREAPPILSRKTL